MLRRVADWIRVDSLLEARKYLEHGAAAGDANAGFDEPADLSAAMIHRLVHTDHLTRAEREYA
jgi:hypothetical protein